MSYDTYLKDPKTNETIHFNEPHGASGGTYAFGGTTEAWLNITYNYSGIFHKVLGEKGIRTIYGMTGKKSINILEKAASKLKKEKDLNYWKATEGNVRHAIVQLIHLAKKRPDGVWKGD